MYLRVGWGTVRDKQLQCGERCVGLDELGSVQGHVLGKNVRSLCIMETVKGGSGKERLLKYRMYINVSGYEGQVGIRICVDDDSLGCQ